MLNHLDDTSISLVAITKKPNSRVNPKHLSSALKPILLTLITALSCSTAQVNAMVNTVTDGGTYEFESSNFNDQLIDIYTQNQKIPNTLINVNKSSSEWLEITRQGAWSIVDIYNGDDQPNNSDPKGSVRVDGNLKIFQDASNRSNDTRVINVLTGNYLLTINGDLDLSVKGSYEQLDRTFNFWGEVIRSYGSEISINGSLTIAGADFSSASAGHLFVEGIYAVNDSSTGIAETNINIGDTNQEHALLIQNISAAGGKETVNAFAVFAEGVGSKININASTSICGVSAAGSDSTKSIEASGLTVYGGTITVSKAISLEKISAQGGSSLSTGIQVYPGEVRIDGDLVIKDLQGRKTYSLYAINDSLTESAIVEAQNVSMIEGDVLAKRDDALDEGNGSKIILGLDGNGKYLKFFSFADNVSTFDINLSNDARWEVVTSNPLTYQGEESYESNVSELSLKGGKVYVGTTESGWSEEGKFSESLRALVDTDKAVQLKIKTLNGNGDFYLRTNVDDVSDNILITDSLSGDFRLNIKATGQEPPEVQENSFLVRTESSVGATGSEFTLGGGKEINGVQLIDIGNYNYKLETSERNEGQEWYLVRAAEQDNPDPIDPTPIPDPEPSPDPIPVYSPTAEAVLAMAGMGAQSSFYQNQLSDVRKRLGEIRNGIRNGLWASVAGQKDRMSGFASTSFKQDAYRFNFGADTVVGSWILGGNFKYISANQKTRDTYFKAKGDAHSEGLNLYATWQNEKGCYVDFVLSADLYHQKISNSMLNGTSVKGTNRNIGLGVSAEIGRKFLVDEAQTWFAEPQLQLSYYHIKGDDFTMSNGMKISQGNFNSLTGRIGVAAGRDFKGTDGSDKGQVYLRAGLKYEFLGNQDIRINSEKFRDDLIGARVYYGAGTDWRVSKNLKIFGHVERENGSHYTKEFEVMVGLKYAF